MAIHRQIVNVPFGAGVSTKPDALVLEAPKLTTAQNVRFTETGGLQKRNPFAHMHTRIRGGGTLSDIRKIDVYDDELLCFTKDKIYSWSESLDLWIERDTHLAVGITEQPVVTSNAEQAPQDRAEVNGLALYLWIEDDTDPWIAVRDVVTGAYVYGPEEWNEDGNAADAVRVVALQNTWLTVFGESGSGDVFATVVDPDDIAGSISSGAFTVNSGSDYAGHFDVAAIDGQDEAYIAWDRTTATSYGLARINASGFVSRQTEGRNCDGPISIAGFHDGSNVRLGVARVDGTAVDGDIFTDLATDSVNLALGTIDTLDDQVTCEWRNTAESNGAYRCYAFWSASENEGSSDFETTANYMDTGGNVGTEFDVVKKCGVASHAFAHDGRVYVWLAFAAQSNTGGGASPVTLKAQLQNSYFLYRDDGRLVSRAVFQRGGGFAPEQGCLPGVQRISANRYRWLGLERRVIELSAPEDNTPSTGYAARSPVDITIDFDAKAARRAAQIGRTLYVAGGQVLQFDGQSLVELGYHTAPWYFDMLELGTGSPAIPADSIHTFYLTFGWENARGELDRSTSQVSGQGTTSATARWQLDPKPLSVTRKAGAAIEAWRTQTAPVPDAPAYLITSKDPADTGDNGYEANDPTAASQTITDNFTDATLATKELYPESGAVLASIAPPSASIIYASDERIFLAGLAENPYRLAYSKLRSAGSVASFNDALFVDLPRFGGPITAVAEFYGNVVVFQESAVFSLPGSGFDNIGGGSNYGPPQLVASDVGAESQEAVVLTPEGLVFKSAKGWHIFDRGFTVRYIGDDVDAFDDETVLASHVLEDQHELRVLTSERCLVYDFVAKQWAHWTLTDGVSATLWQGQYVYATDEYILIEDQLRVTPAYYSMVVETAWIKLSGLQGFGRCRHASVMGRYLSEHTLKVEVGRDGNDEYFQSKVWTPPDTQPYQLRHALSIQKLQSVRFRLTDLDIDGENLPPGQSLSLSGLALEVGLKRGFRPRTASKLQ